MKNRIVKIVVVLVVVMLTASCEKDWLDVSPSSQIDADEQFSSLDGYKDALMGVYISMSSPDLYAKDMTWNLVDILSQQYAPLPSLALYKDVQQFNYRTTRSTEQIDGLWIKQYNAIANINNALKYIDKNREIFTDADYSIIKGELLGLRAFLHFDLIRLYGYGNYAQRNVSGELAIPYVTEFSKEIPPQRSYAETFSLLEKDITNALELLKMDPIYSQNQLPSDFDQTVNRDGFYNDRVLRMNYYAVKALQARVYLWEGSDEAIEKAGKAAEEVITEGPFHLIDATSYPVSDDPILYPEMIFGLDVNAFADIVDPYHDVSQTTNYNALYMTQVAAKEIFETDSVNIGVADIRFNTLLEAHGTKLVSVKLKQDGVTNRNVMPLITLPEMYYIVAEASINDSKNLAKANDYLNEVRTSRGIISQIPNSADQTRLTQELYKEYRKEFVSEGQLFFFYKRLGETTIPGVSGTVTIDDDIYMLPYPDNEFQFGRENR